MKCIEIDLEFRSDIDLTKAGVYRYADSPYFAITLMGISVDDGEVQQYDFTAGDTVPDNILRALVDESIIKRGHNVNFERICFSRYLRDNYPHIFRSYSINEDTVGDYLSPRGWHCTIIHCRTLALPSTLADAGAALLQYANTCCCFIVAKVHDEIIIETDKRMSVDAVCEQMGKVPPWAKGLILRADGYECDFYQKNYRTLRQNGCLVSNEVIEGYLNFSERSFYYADFDSYG